MRSLSAASESSILALPQQSVSKLILKRPKALNALNSDMISLLTNHVSALQSSEICKTIVLMSSPGDRAFCAGGDVKTLVQETAQGEAHKAHTFFKTEYKLNHLLGTSKKPVISILDGITMGGGAGISWHGTFRVVTEKTVFSMPETAIGLIPDVGGSFFLSRMDGYLGTFLGLTGHVLKGQDVYFSGVGTHYIKSERIPSLLQDLSQIDSDNPEVVNGILDDYTENIPLEQWKNWSLGGEIGETIDRCFKFSTIPEIVSELEKENTPFAKKQLEILRVSSPMSLLVTLEQLRKGKTLDFASCFHMEYALAKRLLSEKDFTTGVTEKLIKKSAEPPAWSPSYKELFSQPNETLAAIIKSYFAPQKKELNLEPTFREYPHRTLSGLPSDRDLQRVLKVLKRSSSSKTEGIQTSDILDWFELNWGHYDSTVISSTTGFLPSMNTIDAGSQGRGRPGLSEKLLILLDKYTETVPLPKSSTGQTCVQWKESKL